MQTNDKHIPETVDQIHLYSWASKCVCGCSAHSRDQSWFLAVYYIDCSETSDHPHVCLHVFVLHWCSSALWTRRTSFRLVCCLRYRSFTLSCTSEIQQKVVPVGTAPRAPPEGSWASAPSTGAIQTSLPQLLTHDLDHYFPSSSQRQIPSPRLVCFVPPIHFFPYYTNDVWTDKHLHHFLKGSWILFWVAFGIVRSIHHRNLQLKWTDSQIRQEQIFFFKGNYGCRDQAHSEVCFSDFKVLYLHPECSE